MTQIKNPEEIAETVLYDSGNIEDGVKRYSLAAGTVTIYGIPEPTGLAIRQAIVNAIKADQTQRPGLEYGSLDQLLAAWDAYDGDVSGFYDAWIAHVNEGADLPEWAKRS